MFTGGHDNGYASTLNSLNNEGLLDKIILLRGYEDVAFELKALQLPFVELETVFMTQKINYATKKSSGSMQVEPEKRNPRSIANSFQLSSPKLNPKSRRYSNSVSSLPTYCGLNVSQTLNAVII